MGIRFLCSSCQYRLNVKTKQAGQFCICPDCENEIQIPLQSTIEPIKKKRKRKGKRRGEKRSHVEVEIAPLSPDQLSVELQPSLSIASPYVEKKTIEDSALFVAPKPSGEPAAQQDSDLPDSSSAVADSSLSDVAANVTDSASVPDDFLSGESDSSSQNFSEADSFLLKKPTVKIEDDPLRSDPNLVWYLRHKRLGEKGPLKAAQVEAMLESGQLRTGYIVWREDWNDWVPVEKVFPELATKPSDSTYQIPDELNPHSEVSRKRRAQKRFWMCFNAAAFLIVILLVYWITHLGW
jgi:uncharacterized protein YlaI